MGAENNSHNRTAQGACELMRTNDITITAYPKSGITYLGFLLTAARAKANGLKILPTFFNIDWLLIDSHKMAGREYAHIWNDGMGDFIKTHGVWLDVPSVVYLLRNPYDTLRSYFHFERQQGKKLSIEQFLEAQIPQWLGHVKSWLIDNRSVSQSIFLVEYEKLNAETVQELARQLGFEWTITDYSAETMRGAERSFATYNPVYRRFQLEFVRPGKTREVEGFEEYRTLIESRCAEVYARARGIECPNVTVASR